MKVLIITTSLRPKSNSDALAGHVFAGGVTDMGEIEGHPALQKAYAMGKSIH